MTAKEGAARVSVGSPRRKEIMWLAKKCHQKQGLRRRVLFAERKWSLSASHQFCSAGSSKISRSHVRSAVLRKNLGSSAFEDLIEQRKSVAPAHTSDLVAISAKPPKSRHPLAPRYPSLGAMRRRGTEIRGRFDHVFWSDHGSLRRHGVVWLRCVLRRQSDLRKGAISKAFFEISTSLHMRLVGRQTSMEC